jgi:hypothetical protein
MPKYKELFNNDLDEGSAVVFTNFEDAHISSIQTALNKIWSRVTDDKGYVKNVDEATDTDAIVKACDDLKKAVKGKFVSKFQLTDTEDEK